jgi:chromosome segregation ATPase
LALSTSLASSESQVQQLTRQLEDLASQSLEPEVSSLKASIETVTKEKQEAIQLSTRLQTELDTITRELSTSQEDLKVDRAELDVLRIQLADITSKETNARAEIETVQDQLHAAVREKTNIENELADIRSSFADRSTESESEARNGELLGLQSELDSARRSAEDRERALEQEIDGLKFVKEKDAETAQRRISNLQGQVAKARGSVQEVESKLQAKISELEADLQLSRTRVAALEAEITTLTEAAKVAPRSTTNPDRLGLLYSKIQSLRAERDELRLALSFAQNESRFTLRGVEADKQAAVEELEAVKSDLNKQLATHKTLEQEVSSIRAQLGEKELKLEEIKNELAGADDKVSADKIAKFESEVASAKAERDQLVKDLNESQTQIVELNHAMAMMRTNTESDKRLRKISMERKVLDMPKITETSTGVALDRGPVEFGRRPTHARTKSEIATLVLPDQAQINGLTAKVAELETEVRTLAGKLERRNGESSSSRNETDFQPLSLLYNLPTRSSVWPRSSVENRPKSSMISLRSEMLSRQNLMVYDPNLERQLFRPGLISQRSTRLRAP